ncbi:MAG: carboxynorspermidine decarboxylase [Bacteroidota bacterium]
MDYSKIPSPSFVLDEERLIANLELIQRVQREACVDIILAFKGFAMWPVFPLVRQYLKGATASSLNEARLCFEEMGEKAHTYMVAYPEKDFDQIAAISSHLTFNSLNQWEAYKTRIPSGVSCALRINPEWSDVTTDLYNPADATSRLGLTSEHLKGGLPPGIEGLHLHVLCESDAQAMERVLEAVEQKFGHLLADVTWLNLGGGHLMTHKAYEVHRLIALLTDFRKRHGLRLILEPGSAVAWDTGDLRATVLDIVENGGILTAITDISVTCHMPDCLEMPYRPRILNAHQEPSEGPYRYRIGGLSCLAGDYLDEYSFEQPLKIGDPLVFQDMMHYTMVKTTTFNGISHPDIGVWREGKYIQLRSQGYESYKRKLG